MRRQVSRYLYSTLTNTTRGYSPVTLSSEWPAFGRLVFMVVCAFLGSIINGFFVATFFIERSLNREGNVFLACVGLSDMIVTSAVIPISAVVLLSGEWDVLPVCHALQFLTETSTYCYNIFFALVSAETYYRICRKSREYEMFASARFGCVSILVFATGFLVAGFGVYLQLDYDYCQRQHFGNISFRIATAIIFHVIPFLVTIFGLIAASVRLRRRACEQIHYKRTQQYEIDNSIIHINITTYLLYVIAWTPYLIVVYEYPNTSDTKFYHCVWIGVCRSIITSLLYSALDRNFRRGFTHLFYYCFCKSTVTGSFNSRHRRALEYKPATGDVRVHIMHQAVKMYTPQRSHSSSRETQEL